MRRIDIEQAESVFDTIEKSVCDYCYNALFEAANKANEAADYLASEDLRLLGHVTSMTLLASNSQEPFAPIMELDARRSAIPSDFTEGELDRLVAIIEEIKCPEFRARIADLLWVRRRDAEMARTAVDAYMESANQLLDEEYWTFAGERVSRALRLTLMLGRGAEDLRDAVTIRLQQCLENPGALGNTPFPVNVLQLMVDTRCGESRVLLKNARSFAQMAESARDWHLARSYWEIILLLSARLDDRAVQRESLEKISEGYANLARSMWGDGQGAGLAAAHWMQHAVEAYQRIPKFDRPQRNDLYRELLRYQKASLKDMKKLDCSTDLREITERSRKAVTKGNLLDAVMSLAFLISPPDYDKLRESAEEKRAKYPLQSLFSPVHLDYEGKVIAKTPTGWPGGNDDAAKALWAGTLQEADLTHGLNAQAVIDPARQQILLNHFVQLRDIFPLVMHNPVVPPGHERLWAEGLHAGLTGDLSIAIHMLVPQVENSLRYILQGRGVMTSELKPWGLQENQRLGGLLRSEGLIKIFGRNFIFDLRAILVEPTSANLRNIVAHGLAPAGQLYTPTAVYFWWLCLHLCLLPVKTNIEHNAPDSG